MLTFEPMISSRESALKQNRAQFTSLSLQY